MNDSMQTPPETIHETLTPLTAEPVTETPLAEFLRSRDGSQDQDAHATSGEGLNVKDGDKQFLALTRSAGALDLGLMAQIAILGQDRLRWLNGMLTNNIQGLEEERGNYNFILNAQGRIQGDGYVYRQGERLLLHTSRSQVERLLEHLDHFIIMDDVELRVSNELTALGLAGPGAMGTLAILGLPELSLEPLTLTEVEIRGVRVTLVRSYSVAVPRYELWLGRQYAGAMWDELLDAGATACNAAAAEALRVFEGIPLYGVDLHDRDLPQETGQDRALNFSKGCYLGQEIVERIRSRGNVHRVFMQMELSGSAPATPAELRVNGKTVGQITSTALIPASLIPASEIPPSKIPATDGTRLLGLGFLRSEVLAGSPGTRGAAIEYDGGTAVPVQKASQGAEFASLK